MRIGLAPWLITLLPAVSVFATDSRPASQPASQPAALGEVTRCMIQAGQHLEVKDTGQKTQSAQQQAIDLLSALIQQAEQQEKQSKCSKCGGKGCSQCSSASTAGAQQPGSPAEKSTAPGGKPQPNELRPGTTARPGDAWGTMRPEQREQILQTLQNRFPSQYRPLVEQYYRQMSKEK